MDNWKFLKKEKGAHSPCEWFYIISLPYRPCKNSNANIAVFFYKHDMFNRWTLSIIWGKHTIITSFYLGWNHSNSFLLKNLKEQI
jgi:hypothetical protein